MLCNKCGHEIPENASVCTNCSNPAKKRQRVKTRMFLGMVIFFIGVLTGIMVERILLTENKSENRSDFTSSEKLAEIETRLTPVVLFSSDKADYSEKSEQESEHSGSADAKTSVAIDTSLSSQKEETGKSESALENKLIEPKQSSFAGGTVENSSNTLIIPQNPVVVAAIATAAADFGKPNRTEESGTAIASEEPEFETAEPIVPQKLAKQKFDKVVSIEDGPGNNYHGIYDSLQNEIIFVSDRLKVNGRSTYQCFSKHPGSKEALKLFDWSGNVWTPEPVANSGKIVFSSDCVSPEHIFVWDRETEKSEALTSGKYKNMMPAVSPDGQKIAFVSNSKGRNSIWVMNTDGSEQTMITSGAYDDREPRWAGNGRSIIFTRIFESLKKSHILEISYPDKVITPIIATDRRNWLADVSPDGNYIAYTRSEGANGSSNSIVLRDLETGNEEILKFAHATENLRPIWAADSMSFIFHSIKKTGRSLYQAVFKRENN